VLTHFRLLFIELFLYLPLGTGCHFCWFLKKGGMMKIKNMNRRDFVKTAAAGAGLLAFPMINCGKIGVSRPMKRTLGRTGFEATTLGLGGQASLQWTPPDVDPGKIILKAFDLGINYFDTSNLYGPSQQNYGKVFRQLNLVPGNPGYNESARRSIFLTTKTHLRWAKGLPDIPEVHSWSNGGGASAVDDIKRSLSLMFGDGNGGYPDGAYLDMVLIHSISSMAEVEAVYEGLDHPDPKAEAIGALAALKDYRDGSNLTGLNPNEEKLIRHLGFSGHYSPAVMMAMIQRDTANILDGLLVAVNANDFQQFNMQNNVIPVAQAKNIGVIAMKVFADGAMYDKGAHWSNRPDHVVRRIGSPELPSRLLVEYSLSTPGVHNAIIGIGEISDDDRKCQLKQNLSAAQIRPQSMSIAERIEVETLAATVKSGKTNYFQLPGQDLTPVQNPEVHQVHDDFQLIWHSAFAGRHPIERYDIYRGGEKIGTVAHHPQTSQAPFEYVDQEPDPVATTYRIVTVDRGGQEASVKVSEES
jgi:aryl-alcohol dehydrogenase-like predicted oxidoreductase